MKTADLAKPGPEGNEEIERDTDAGEELEGKRAVRKVRVEDGAGVRDGFTRRVVIGDDEVNAESPAEFRLGHGGDTAVHGDDDPGANRRRSPDSRLGEAVPMLHPVGDVIKTGEPDAPEELDEERRRRYPVHVVIAVDADRLPSVSRSNQTLDRCLHPAHEKRVMAVGQRSVEEPSGGHGIRYSPVDEEPRQQLRDSRPPRHSRNHRPVGLPQPPPPFPDRLHPSLPYKKPRITRGSVFPAIHLSLSQSPLALIISPGP